MWRPVLDALLEGNPAKVAQTLVQQVQSQAGVDSVAIVRAAAPHWDVVASEGSPPPLELAADALDRDAVVDDARWSAAPLPAMSEALLVRPVADPNDLADLAESIAGWQRVAQRMAALQRDAREKQALLKLVNEWRQTNDLKQLLDQMAHAACELFDADRASIFLWDRAAGMLVGRPAMGIEDGELRVPDGAGVVGEVLRTGEPLRVSPRTAAHKIDHSIDAKTGYHTQSLLAAPLVTLKGERLGVFEMINKRGGVEFSLEDERGLLRLADYASSALAATQEYEGLLSRHEKFIEQQAEGVRLIGDCPAMVALRSTISRVADTDLSVLILGENGAGKEVIAQSLHYGSRRRAQPFVAVNCAAIAETLLESELFGHEKGAFTDARETRAGKFELAAGGTLLLDEIGDMSPGGQAKLLRALEDKKITRVGGTAEIATDVRVLAATNQDLAALVREKRFREDLYFRLNVVTLETPALRQRGDDILTLADHFLSHFCRAAGRAKPRWTAESKKRLFAHRWPGNVRELRNTMERLVYLTTGDKIQPEDLSFTASPAAQRESLLDLGLPLAEATEEFQRRYIQATVKAARGNVSDAAKMLGVFRSNLYRKMKALDCGPTGEGD